MSESAKIHISEQRRWGAGGRGEQAGRQRPGKLMPLVLWCLGKQRSHALVINGQMLREYLCLWPGEGGVTILVAHHTSAMFSHSGRFPPWRTFLAFHEGIAGKAGAAKTLGRGTDFVLWIP